MTKVDAPCVITSVYASSDIGNFRDNNEDNFIIADLVNGQGYSFPQSIRRNIKNNRLLMAVSDGIGGREGGEIASAIAVYGLRLELLRLASKAAIYEVDWLVKALEHINKLIWRAGKENQQLKGMGATITAALISGSRAYIAEVGDSRAYLVRNNQIKQITTDQSLFEILSSDMEIEHQPSENTRSIILQSVGGQENLDVAVTILELCQDDFLLICSDGLSNNLTATEIEETITKSSNLEQAVTSMIELSKERGGEDNITLILTKFEGDALPKSTDKSITSSLKVLTAFNPLSNNKGKQKRITQQMVSELHEREEKVFRSTLGVMSPTSYPARSRALSESDKSIELLHNSANQLVKVVDQIHVLEKWLEQQGRLDPALQKAIVHLEHAIKNTQKIEIVARKARNLIERLTAKNIYPKDNKNS